MRINTIYDNEENRTQWKYWLCVFFFGLESYIGAYYNKIQFVVRADWPLCCKLGEFFAEARGGFWDKLWSIIVI